MNNDPIWCAVYAAALVARKLAGASVREAQVDARALANADLWEREFQDERARRHRLQGEPGHGF